MGQQEPVQRSRVVTPVERILGQALASVLEVEEDEALLTASFAELGIDSLLALRLCRKVEERLGIQIEPEWLFDCLDARRLAGFLDTRLSSAAVLQE
jgi:acyl carrier protein